MTADRAERLHARAAAANRAGQPRRALEICGMALNLRPDDALAARLYRERTAAWRQLGRADRACGDAGAAFERDRAPESQALLGMALLDNGAPDDAARALAGVLADGDGVPTAWWAALGRAHLRAGRGADAVLPLRRAADGIPDDRALRIDLARAYLASGSPGEAEGALLPQVERAPDDVEAIVLLGVAADAAGETLRAAQLLERALALEGDRPDAHLMLAVLRLRASGGREGWDHYEWRQPSGGAERRMGVPAWRGRGGGDADEIRGRRVIIWSEQGYGDNLQFLRFIPLARARGAHTIYMAPRGLVPLLRRTAALGEVIAREPPYPRGDLQTLVMSLPQRLGLGSPFEVPGPYLEADPERRAVWRRRLGDGIKVVLAWQGNPHYAGDPSRSMPVAFHVPLLRRFQHQIRFLSVQKNAGREQLGALPSELRFEAPDSAAILRRAPRLDLADAIDGGPHAPGEPPFDAPADRGAAFMDTAAILRESDLVITTDTALAHLAGALGARTWTLLGATPDFRWGTDGARTGWYPSMRLFRQSRAGDWAGVVSSVMDALAALIAAGTSARGD